MRLPAILLPIVFLNACGSSQAKPAQAGKRKGDAMSQRVFYSPAPVGDAVRAARPDFLGQVSTGSWFGVEDAAALDLWARDKAISLLYPERAEYEDAMQGLDATQRAEAVAWRLKVWSPRAKDEILPGLFEKEQFFLARLARSSAQPGKAGEAYRAAFNEELRILDHLLFVDRYRGWETREHVSAVFEALNDVNGDAEGLAEKSADKSLFPSPELAGARLALALEAQKAMKRYGLLKDVNPSGRVHVAIQRGVFVSPTNAAIVRSLHESHEPVQEVEGGFVALWNDHDFASLAEGGRTVELLYPYASRLLADFSRLTEAQRVLKFARLRKQEGPSAIASHLAYLQLHLVLTLNNLASTISGKEPELAARMTKHSVLETEELRLALIKWPVWGVEAPDPLRLKAAADAGLSDLVFWQSASAKMGWTAQSPEIDKALELKRALIDRLKRADP